VRGSYGCKKMEFLFGRGNEEMNTLPGCAMIHRAPLPPGNFRENLPSRKKGVQVSFLVIILFSQIPGPSSRFQRATQSFAMHFLI
jgi:hypothetical protein